MLNKIFLIAFGVFACATNARAEQMPSSSAELLVQCAQLVRECVHYQGMERSNCYRASAAHPYCENTELGALAKQRWVMSPLDTSTAPSPPAFLGPKLVKEECIVEFDKDLATELKNSPPSVDRIRELHAGLEECKKDISSELQRP